MIQFACLGLSEFCVFDRNWLPMWNTGSVAMPDSYDAFKSVTVASTLSGMEATIPLHLLNDFIVCITRILR